MKKNTSTKLSKKLAKYGALSLAIAGVADATGQIVYTDVDPDETIDGSSFMLDLNGDGVIDYDIIARSGPEAVRMYNTQGNSVLGSNAGGNYNYPDVLSSGSAISSGGNFYTDPNYQTLNWDACAYTNSQWCDGQVDKYVGLRFNVDGNQHYGWAKIDLPADGSSFTIKGYAFNSVPDAEISAGEGESLGINNQIFSGFTHFVAQNELNLKANTAMSSVAIFDITGKQVISQNLTSTNAQVNIAGINTGVYIATVTVEGSKKTFKFVK